MPLYNPGDVTQAELDSVETTLQTNIDTNTTRLIGAFRLAVYNGSAWESPDGESFPANAAARTTGRLYFWEGPQAQLDTVAGTTMLAGDVAVPTD